MGRYNSYPEFTAPSQPFESVLRTGQARIRPYKSGSVKHAHVVLKKVGEEAYEDSKGRKRARGVFSFFAAKVINCKPGKEIFFAIDNYLDERVVTFEADLHHPDDADNDVLTSAKSEETLVQHEAQSHSLPPKMRKMWARKEVVAVKQESPHQANQQTATVGVQASPTSASISVQASLAAETDINGLSEVPFSLVNEEEPSLLSTSVESQIADIHLEDSSSDGRPTSSHPRLAENFGPPTPSSPKLVSSVTNDINTKIDLSQDMRERSLSPMELDSAPSSPENSPRISVLPLPVAQHETDVKDSIAQPQVRGKERLDMLVESLPLIVKEEPEEVTLPPSPKSKSLSQPFRAPIFVPARNNPFQTLAESQDRRSSDMPERFETPITSRLDATIRQNRGETGAEVQQSISTAIAPSVYSLSAKNDDLPSSSLIQSGNAPSRASTYPPPIFVPATQLSQMTTVPSSQTESEPFPPNEVVDPTGEQSASGLSISSGVRRSWDGINKKRKRLDGIPEAIKPESQEECVGLPNKKWRPIVKQESQSPVLSATLPAESPLSYGTSRTLLPHPLPLSVSIPSFTSTLASPSSSQPLTRQSSMPTIMKSQHAGHYSLDFDPSMNWPVQSAASSRRASKPYTDLATASIPYRDAAAPVSAPVKRFNRTRQRVPGICSSLPIIKTAQIKMDIGSRDTVGVRAIVFDPSGVRFAVVCRDSTVRIWDSTSFEEIAKLAHSGPVVSVAWMAGDISIASLGANGVVSKWSLVGKNRWMWEKLVDSGDTDPSCFACYRRDFAIASNRRGVRIWECRNGLWVPMQWEVPCKDVLTIKFISEGDELLCGCSDGTLLRCSVLDCQVQQVMNFKTKVFHIDADPTKSHALVAQALGSAHLVDFASGNKRPFDRVLQDYSLRDAEQQYSARGVHGFKPIFTDYGDAVVFGAIEGRVLVWDRRRGQIVYEMDHGSDVHVQAVASFDNDSGDQHLVSCTKYGLLTWWRLPIRIF